VIFFSLPVPAARNSRATAYLRSFISVLASLSWSFSFYSYSRPAVATRGMTRQKTLLSVIDLSARLLWVRFPSNRLPGLVGLD